MKTQDGKIVSAILSNLVLLAIMLTFAADIFAQRTSIRPPRVEGQTTVGTINGQPITGNDLILMIGSDSPFMPPLDGSPIPVLQQFENNNPVNPNPSPTPTTTPKPVAPSFAQQIQNMMKTGQEWLSSPCSMSSSNR